MRKVEIEDAIISGLILVSLPCQRPAVFLVEIEDAIDSGLILEVELQELLGDCLMESIPLSLKL